MLSPAHDILGSALTVTLPSLRSGKSVEVVIFYSTTRESTALGWLEKECVCLCFFICSSPFNNDLDRLLARNSNICFRNASQYMQELWYHYKVCAYLTPAFSLSLIARFYRLFLGENRTSYPVLDRRCLTLALQTYSANVKSVLPVLLSAIRISPPPEQVHGGQEVGFDEVVYVYKQVC